MEIATINMELFEKLPSGAAIIIGTTQIQYVICREGTILKMFKVIEVEVRKFEEVEKG